nr:MAG TPA: tail tape measure [Caudoviricetes sp.]
MAEEGLSLGTAWIDVVPSFKGLKKRIEEELGALGTSAVTEASESWGSKIGQSLSKHIGGALSSIGKLGLGGVAAAVGGITAALAAQVPAAIAASDATDKFKKTLEFAGVDPSRIKQLTKAAQSYADQTVYDLSDIQSVTAQLAANGVKDFDKMAEAAGNVNAIAGGTKETFKQVALALVQINGAGKLTTQDWNQIAGAIPGASGKIQEALKANAAFTGDFRDAMSKGQITAEEFNQALMDLGFTDVAQEAAKSASTFEGAWGNLEAAVEKGLVASLDKVKEPLTDIINAVGEQVGPAFDEAGKHVDVLAGKLRPFADAMKDGKLTLEDIAKALGQATGGFAALAGAGTLLADPSLIIGAFDALPSPSALVDRFSGLGGAVKDGVGKVFAPAAESVGQHAKSLGSALKAGAGEAASNISSAIGEKLSGVGRVIREAGDKHIGPSFGIISEELLDAGGVLKEGTGKALGPAMQAMHGVGPKMGQALAGAAGHIGPAAEGLISQVGMFLNPARFGKVLAFGGLITAAVAGLGALVQASGGELTTQIQTVISDMILNVSKYGMELVSNAPQLIASGAEAVKTLITGITNALPVLLNMAGLIIESFVGSFSSWLPQLIPAAAQMIVALVKGLVDMLPQLINAGVELINGLVAGLTAAIPVIVAALPGIITSLLNALSQAVPQLIQAGLDLLLGLVNGLVAALPTLATVIPQIITTVVTTLVTALPQLIEAGTQVLQALIDGLVVAIPLLMDMLPQIITTIVDTLVQNLPLIIDAGLNLLMTLINGIITALPLIIDMLPQIITTIVDVLVQNLPLIINAGVQLLMGLINGLTTAIPQLIAMLPQIITTIVTVLVQNVPKILAAGIALVGGLASGLIQAVPALLTAVGQVTSKILSALDNAPKLLFDSGKKIIQGLANGISSMASAAKNAVTGVMSSVRNLLPFSPAKEGPFSGKGWSLYSGQSIVEALAEGAASRSPLFEEAIRETMAAGQAQLAELELGAMRVSAGLGGASGLARMQISGPQTVVVRDSDNALIGRMRVEASGAVSEGLAPVSRAAMRERIGF